jgi:class 3 adenylate cyclase
MAVALATLPAVLSATGKIADAVMERLHPLSTGFECVAQGDLHVRVEEKGSRDFVRISKGFNHMTTSLVQTLSNLDERNRELAELNEAAQRFVPFEFLKLLDRESLREVRRGDQVELEISVLFSDIRGFTPLAERLGPEATFRLINRYLGLMDPEIHSRGGFINDYLGDGIMALFHTGARDAVDAGVSMLRAVERLNTELGSEGADPIRVGIGLHTGRLMLGTIGGQQRLDCTVIGDPANLASRVEGMTKLYGARMLVTEDTIRALVDPERFPHRELDRVRAKGKTEAVTVYEVLDGPMDEAKVETRRIFSQGLEAYRGGRFEEARLRFLDCLRDAPQDVAAGLYVERCEARSKSDVPEGWCGITELTQK